MKQRHNLDVMPALVAGIHVFLRLSKTWMAGTSGAKTALRAFRPAMTDEGLCILYAPGHGGSETV